MRIGLKAGQKCQQPSEFLSLFVLMWIHLLDFIIYRKQINKEVIGTNNLKTAFINYITVT